MLIVKFIFIMERIINIGENFHFGLHKLDPQRTEKALKYYQSHQLKEDQEWLYDKDGIDIFLDANVLINLYAVSKRMRDTFLKFMQENADRIYIAHQVSDEYMTHRIQAIKNGPKAIDKLQQSLIDYCDSFLKSIHNIEETLKNKTDDRGLLNDMQDTKNGLNDLLQIVQPDFKNGCEKYGPLLQKIKQNISKDITLLRKDVEKENEDSVIKCVCQMRLLPSLSSEEKTFLNKLYDTLWNESEKYNGGESRDIYAFPGRGDHKKLAEGKEPYGDLYIYHEILSYMKESHKDVVFITGDRSKEDWIKKDGTPYIQYIIDAYANTEHMLFVMDINRLSIGLRSNVNEAEEVEIIDSIEPSPITCDTQQTEQGVVEEPKNNDEQNAQQQYQNYLYAYLLSEYLKKKENANQEQNKAEVSLHREITEERFLSELSCSEKWAKTYGNGYVSVNFFIRDILGNKDFDYQKSYEMLENLIQAKKVIKKEQDMEGHKFASISIAHNSKTQK